MKEKSKRALLCGNFRAAQNHCARLEVQCDCSETPQHVEAQDASHVTAALLAVRRQVHVEAFQVEGSLRKHQLHRLQDAEIGFASTGHGAQRVLGAGQPQEARIQVGEGRASVHQKDNCALADACRNQQAGVIRFYGDGLRLHRQSQAQQKEQQQSFHNGL